MGLLAYAAIERCSATRGVVPEQARLLAVGIISMRIDFHAELTPGQAVFQELSQLAPDNPFCTPAYVEAMRECGARPWVLALKEGNQLLAGCAAFLSSGRLSRALEVPSLPALADEQVFWDGLRQTCRHNGVTSVELNSYASPVAVIPASAQRSHWTKRVEYVIDLRAADLSKAVRKTHQQRIKRARKAGLVLQRSREASANQEHQQMMLASLQRRKERGETVPEEVQNNLSDALLHSGAGQLFQAVVNGKVYSSGLVLLSERGAYYHTSGTRPEGMECGASHFLIFEIAETLRNEGYTHFNLGGAQEGNAGLHEFKQGFGAAVRHLEAAQLDFGTGLHKMLLATARTFRGWLRRPQPGPCAS
jgi:lipid II:glycine glycyltransferase (peptidoglycan interpeptide bridge formation enzyme)